MSEPSRAYTRVDWGSGTMRHGSCPFAGRAGASRSTGSEAAGRPAACAAAGDGARASGSAAPRASAARSGTCETDAAPNGGRVRNEARMRGGGESGTGRRMIHARRREPAERAASTARAVPGRVPPRSDARAAVAVTTVTRRCRAPPAPSAFGMLRPLTLALAQFKPRKGDYAANLERIGALLAQADA